MAEKAPDLPESAEKENEPTLETGTAIDETQDQKIGSAASTNTAVAVETGAELARAEKMEAARAKMHQLHQSVGACCGDQRRPSASGSNSRLIEQLLVSYYIYLGVLGPRITHNLFQTGHLDAKTFTDRLALVMKAENPRLLQFLETEVSDFELLFSECNPQHSFSGTVALGERSVYKRRGQFRNDKGILTDSSESSSDDFGRKFCNGVCD